MNDSPRAVSAAAKLLRYASTRARSARLKRRKVAGVLKPLKPAGRENGNADPPACRSALACSSRLTTWSNRRRVGLEGRRLRRHRGVRHDRNRILRVGVQDDQVVQRLERLGVPRSRGALYVAELGSARQHGQDHVALADGGVLVGPVIAAEGIAAGIERPSEQLAREPRIGAVEPEHLASHDSYVQREVCKVGSERDEHAGRGHADLDSGRIGPDRVGTVGIGTLIEVAGSRGHYAQQEHRVPPSGDGRHGQNPRSIEKKKLRLGGNGATSMFRTMAWLPKLLTSGSSPR